MNRKLPLDPKLGAGADARLVQLLSDAARVTRDLQEQIDNLVGLAGVTATAAELNVLDGITSSTAELNILDGVTATAAELNILDGVTSSATELNLVDGITALAASTYTPTVTDVANTYSLSASVCQYMRINNIITVGGKIAGSTTDAATTTTVEVTLPVASTFTTDAQVAGSGRVLQPGGTNFQVPAQFFSANGGTKARAEWSSSAAGGSFTVYFTFVYQVL